MAAAAEPGVVFAGDGRGGFVIPEFTASIDGDRRVRPPAGARRPHQADAVARSTPASPRRTCVRRSVPTPWATKGLVMRAVVEAAGAREVDTTDGVRVVEPDGSWVLVLPDPAEAVTHLWAEGPAAGAVSALLEQWAAVVDAAGAPVVP